MPDLQDEFAVFRELQDLPILLAIGSDPYEAFRIDMDGHARSAQSYPWRKFEHRRRRRAALAGRRVERRGFFIRRQRLRPLDDPHVVVSVDGHARCLPLIQLLGSAFGQAASTWKSGASAAETDQLRATEATSVASAVGAWKSSQNSLRRC